MTTQIEPVNHVELYEWLKSLSVYKQELKLFRERLSEVVIKNSGADIFKDIEHFQNLLIIHQNHIDLIRHDVKQFENKLELDADVMNDGSNASLIFEEAQLRERLKTFEHLFIDFKYEYYAFIRKYI
ncbi:MAG: hypothetical protein RIQ89_1482 [Bacteroidota bacterium]|jgi:hypothetical protein